MDIKATTGKLLKGDVKGVVQDVKYQIERSVGLIGVIIISLSAMLGSGLFVLPSFAAMIMGEGIWLAFLLAASVVLPGALSKSELSSGMPSSGGSYVYLERTYGPLVGTISGLGLWASFLLKSSFALIGFSAYMYTVTTYFDINLNTYVVSITALVLITVVNIMGVKKVKAIQAPILGLTLSLLVIISIMALFDSTTELSRPWDAAMGTDVWTIAETSAFVFVAYAGVTKVAAIGGEVKNPGKNLPYGIMISLLIATILYCSITYIMMAAIPGEWWVANGETIEDPIYAFVSTVAGTKVGVVAACLAILTMISMALSGILAASRFLFAMARDSLLPQSLEELNSKYETPHWPIIVTATVMGVAILTLPVKDVAKLASGFKIMIFIMINSCVIVLRQTSFKHEWNPEYKGPLYPIIHLWGIIAGLVLVYIMGEKALIGAVAAIVMGLIVYYFYGKKHTHPRITPFTTFCKEFRNTSPSEHDKREFAFHAADKVGKGHLTVEDFQVAMRALEFSYTEEECQSIFNEIDSNDNGYIDIEEFLIQFENSSD
ncbi:amino acid permease [Candidatus Poseidoniaceae archaeon]|nr:amino acid permease [Candidatus Poseidoniaceae archaeon]